MLCQWLHFSFAELFMLTSVRRMSLRIYYNHLHWWLFAFCLPQNLDHIPWMLQNLDHLPLPAFYVFNCSKFVIFNLFYYFSGLVEFWFFPWRIFCRNQVAWQWAGCCFPLWPHLVESVNAKEECWMCAQEQWTSGGSVLWCWQWPVIVLTAQGQRQVLQGVDFLKVFSCLDPGFCDCSDPGCWDEEDDIKKRTGLK